MPHSDLSKYSLEKCLHGDCSGCDREHYASCGELILERRWMEGMK